MHRPLLLLLYNLLLPLLLLVSLPRLWRVTRRRGGYQGRFPQRWNRFDPATASQLDALARRRPFWLHAVSVGEVNVALKWIDALRARRPGAPVVLSTTTTTGHAVASDRLGDQPDTSVIYSPLDLLHVVDGLLRRLQPRALVLVEAEVWPNWVWRARRRQVPVFLVNARLSPRSRARYRRFRALVRPVFDLLEQIHVQEPGDADDWRAIGLDPDCIHLCGSVKYDAPDRADLEREQRGVERLRHLLAANGRPVATPSALCDLPDPSLPSTVAAPTFTPVLLIASSHAGEEAALIGALAPLRAEFPGLQLWVAPRHVERAPEVIAQLNAAGHQVQRRSLWPAAPAPANPPPPTRTPAPAPGHTASPVLLIDTTGELRLWQRLADVVLVGKSFLGRGGQNPAEAVAAGKPVVAGPHMDNFAPLMDRLRQAGGIAQVRSVDEVAPLVRRWLAQPADAAAVAARGREALAWHHGAAGRSVDRLLEALDASDPAPALAGTPGKTVDPGAGGG